MASSIDELPWGELICERLSLRDVACVAAAHPSLRSCINGSEGHWQSRQRRHFGAVAGGGASGSGAAAQQ